MNAREKWDRDFERRKPTNDADKVVLAEDLEAEDERRKAWDQERKKKVEVEKESLRSSDQSMTVSVQEGMGRSVTVSSASTEETKKGREREAGRGGGGGGGLFSRFRSLRVRRHKVADRATQVASDVC